MLRRTFGLSRPFARWLSQVSASLGATLAATAIYAVLPKSAPPPVSPQPEMTSGGKFAARLPLPMAYDGLDTMPLPHVAPAIGPAPAEFPAPPAPRRAAWDGVASERPVKAVKPIRQAARVEHRQAATPMPPPNFQTVADPAPSAATASPGWMPRALSTAEEVVTGALSLTASAGTAVTSRVLPQWR